MENIKKETILLTQTGSSLRKNKRQSIYLKSLGLGKINSSRQLEDTPSVRGLLKKLSHIVKVIKSF